MSQIKKLERLKKAGVLANWEWPQQSWDEIARKYSNSSFSWRLVLAQVSPVILISAGASLGNIYNKKHGSYAINQLTIFDKIVIFGICIFCLMTVYWLLRWLNTEFFPKPKVGHKPTVIISKSGVLVGNRVFFFEPPIVLDKTTLVKSEDSINPYAIYIKAVLGTIANEIIIPVPFDKISEAEQVVEEFSKRKSRVYNP